MQGLTSDLRQVLVVDTFRPDQLVEDRGMCQQFLDYIVAIIQYIGYILTCTFCCRGDSDNAAYSSTPTDITIRVVQNEPRIQPYTHLRELAKHITPTTARLHVRFTDQTGIRQENIEEALAKCYMQNLFAGVMDCRSPKVEVVVGDKRLPRTSVDYVEGSLRIPELTAGEKTAYQSLGKAMRYVYDARLGLTLERRFSHALFGAVLALDTRRVNSLGIIQILMENDESVLSGKKSMYRAAIGFINRGAPLTEGQAEHFRSGLELNGNVDLDVLKNILLEKYGRFVEPIRAVASGLLYEPFGEEDARHLMMTIQGLENH